LKEIQEELKHTMEIAHDEEERAENRAKDEARAEED
jgi:hypothetical protein